MNWVGGARNRIKLKHERKIQKEFFERKRHSKKAIRDENQGKIHQEREGRNGISQDLIALQALASAHDTKPNPREIRKPLALNLDEPKRTGRDAHRRSYAVELPESPRSSCTSFDSLQQLKLSNSTNIHNQRLSKTCGDIELTNDKKAEKDIVSRNSKLVGCLPTKLSPLTPLAECKIANDSQHKHSETQTKQNQMIPDRKPFTLNTWTDISNSHSPLLQERGYNTFSLATENRGFNIIQRTSSPKKTVAFEQSILLGKESPFNRVSYNVSDKMCSEMPRIYGLTQAIGTRDVARNSDMRKTIEGDPNIEMSAFKPFSKLGTPCEPNKARDSDKFKTPKTIHKSFASSASTKSFSPVLRLCNKPLPLDIPMQTWTSRNINDKHWSHFNVYPGHQKKNPFLDKESYELNDNAKKLKDNIAISPKINLLKSEESLLHGKVTPKRKGKPAQEQWNPFNVSYPVKVENKGVSIMGSQETAWRTFLRGSGGFQTAEVQDTQCQLQKDPSFQTPSTVKLATGRNTQNEELEGRESLIIDHEGKINLNKNEALQEVMDMERDEDGQSSGFTSSWSTFSDDEQDDGDDGCILNKDDVSMGVSMLEELNNESATPFSAHISLNPIGSKSTESPNPVSAADSAILSPDPSLEQKSSTSLLQCKEMSLDLSPEKDSIGTRRRKVKKCLFPCENSDRMISKGAHEHLGIMRNDFGNSLFEGSKESMENESQRFTAAKHFHLDGMPKAESISTRLEGSNTSARDALCEGVRKYSAPMECPSMARSNTEIKKLHDTLDVDAISSKNSPSSETDRKAVDKRARQTTPMTEHPSVRTPESIGLSSQVCTTKDSLFGLDCRKNDNRAENSIKRPRYSSKEMECVLGGSIENIDRYLFDGNVKHVKKRAQSSQTDCASYTEIGVQTDEMNLSTCDPCSDLLPAHVDCIAEHQNTSDGDTILGDTGKGAVEDHFSRSSDSWLARREPEHCSGCHEQKDINWYLSVLVNIFNQEKIL